MPLTKIIAFLAALADFVLGGLLSNGFITAVIITEWAKRRSLPASEQLFLSLGISNICFTILLSPKLILSNQTSTVSKTFITLHTSFCYSVAVLRYWLTAWLFLFYCIKILNSTHSFFLWWKIRISRLVPRLIVGSSVISFFSSFSIVLSFYMQFQSNGTGNITNINENERIGKLWKVTSNFFLVSGSSCPLLLVSPCSILVLVFLCQHAGKMTNKGSNLSSIQTEPHVKAARTVLALLFLYISYYMVQIVQLNVLLPKEKASYLVIYTMTLMYSPVQGAILLLSNRKLKQRTSRILERSSC